MKPQAPKPVRRLLQQPRQERTLAWTGVIAVEVERRDSILDIC